MVTLGPVGTDAHHIAHELGEVVLAESFPQAMHLAWEQNLSALICAGFVTRSGETIRDTWVDLHFRYSDRMELVRVWSAATKPMCVAINRCKIDGLSQAATLALHPATTAFADRYAPTCQRIYVDAKPLAVAAAESGDVDACIGSVDVVQAVAHLEVVETFQPQMLWCLYRRTGHERTAPAGSVDDHVHTGGHPQSAGGAR
ncbi:hypothetical protein GCM10014719_65260 [Planomonospora parontospora subsp. antibiotica]|nr:hypothetical protein GCM10014719_65260 [Planomonospora parontospora subsp. antibiotica]GII19289.1 hypothetical protein Ppa05_60150 [Planomonospora parontospora subsp. antibiotica]